MQCDPSLPSSTPLLLHAASSPHPSCVNALATVPVCLHCKPLFFIFFCFCLLISKHTVPFPRASSPHRTPHQPPLLLASSKCVDTPTHKFICLYFLGTCPPSVMPCPLTCRTPHQPPLPQPLLGLLMHTVSTTLAFWVVCLVCRHFGSGSCLLCGPFFTIDYNMYI